MPPNKRVKLPGAIVLVEPIGLCPSGHELTFTHTAGGGPVARSLRAVR